MNEEKIGKVERRLSKLGMEGKKTETGKIGVGRRENYITQAVIENINL